jgi:hypothetical protein
LLGFGSVPDGFDGLEMFAEVQEEEASQPPNAEAIENTIVHNIYLRTRSISKHKKRKLPSRQMPKL